MNKFQPKQITVFETVETNTPCAEVYYECSVNEFNAYYSSEIDTEFRLNNAITPLPEGSGTIVTLAMVNLFGYLTSHSSPFNKLKEVCFVSELEGYYWCSYGDDEYAEVSRLVNDGFLEHCFKADDYEIAYAPTKTLDEILNPRSRYLLSREQSDIYINDITVDEYIILDLYAPDEEKQVLRNHFLKLAMMRKDDGK